MNNLKRKFKLGFFWLLAILACVVVSFWGLQSPGAAGTSSRHYFVNLDGNDLNDGLTPATAWQTLAKVSSITFKAGDRIMLQGGQTFPGSLQVKGRGLPRRPILFTSYGSGTAIIDSQQEIGAIVSTSHVHIKNLTFVGDRSTHGSHYGLLLKNESASQLYGIELDHLDISNYGENGILIKGQEQANHGFSFLRLTHIISHDNRGDGIQVQGSWNREEKTYSHSNLYISDCKVYNNSGYDTQNSSGNGIMVSDVDGAIIEYSEAYNNGYGWGGRGGGPVGIWSWDSNNVVIQHSESHHNKNGEGRYDGGGFDIDGGDTNSIIQYCYSHDNEGPGYFLAHFQQSAATHHNIIRYNISQNDAQSTVQGALNFWSADAGELTDNWVYNNVIYGNESSTVVLKRESSGSHNWVINNIFIASQGIPLIHSEHTPDIHYQNNVYWNTEGPIQLHWGGVQYDTLEEWQLASGQEFDDGTATGLSLNPKLAAPGQGQTIGDPRRLAKLRAYHLEQDSPLIDAALNSRDTFGQNPGEQDFYGNSTPQGATYDIGAHEFS